MMWLKLQMRSKHLQKELQKESLNCVVAMDEAVVAAAEPSACAVAADSIRDVEVNAKTDRSQHAKIALDC
jgi:hypothetical protein